MLKKTFFSLLKQLGAAKRQYILQDNQISLINKGKIHSWYSRSISLSLFTNLLRMKYFSCTFSDPSNGMNTAMDSHKLIKISDSSIKDNTSFFHFIKFCIPWLAALRRNHSLKENMTQNFQKSIFLPEMQWMFPCHEHLPTHRRLT